MGGQTEKGWTKGLDQRLDWGSDWGLDKVGGVERGG